MLLLLETGDFLKGSIHFQFNLELLRVFFLRCHIISGGFSEHTQGESLEKNKKNSFYSTRIHRYFSLYSYSNEQLNKYSTLKNRMGWGGVGRSLDGSIG